ncbi:hypothetical protein PoB_007401700 [Plakobranchus ocellatus]|uniref:Uncharacterized protein n=1 Tax=Plakobranchus ocellatus TaxID=259542 RepID=A0AAV4DU14_9GAST|nr:hypothetical protein PoB_007401700 [Plakobranchus ocellatus]
MTRPLSLPAYRCCVRQVVYVTNVNSHVNSIVLQQTLERAFGCYTVPNSAGCYTISDGVGCYTVPNSAGCYAVPNSARCYAVPNSAGCYIVPSKFRSSRCVG